MNIPALNELSIYYDQIELIEKVVLQLKKDFNWYNLDITFKTSKETAYQKLYKEILPLIEELLNDNYPKLKSLLNRIDVEEDFLNKKLRENPQADTDEVITDLILKRELQKVIIRKLYSQK